MRLWLVMLLALCLLALALSGCGPAPPRQGSFTTGICPECGSANLDVQRQTERSAFDGSETDILVITCRDCGYSWRSPAH